MDVNAVGEKVGLEPMSLSKLRAIKKQTSTTTLQKEAVTSLLGVPNARHQSTFGMHIQLGSSLTLHINCTNSNMCNDYYTNRVLSIARPLEVLTVIRDRMNRAKRVRHYFLIDQGYGWIY